MGAMSYVCGALSPWAWGGAAFLGLDLMVLQGISDQHLLLGSWVDLLLSADTVIHPPGEHALGRGSGRVAIKRGGCLERSPGNTCCLHLSCAGF